MPPTKVQHPQTKCNVASRSGIISCQPYPPLLIWKTVLRSQIQKNWVQKKERNEKTRKQKDGLRDQWWRWWNSSRESLILAVHGMFKLYMRRNSSIWAEIQISKCLWGNQDFFKDLKPIPLCLSIVWQLVIVHTLHSVNLQWTSLLPW